MKAPTDSVKVASFIDSLSNSESKNIFGFNSKVIKVLKNETSETLMSIFNQCLIPDTFPEIFKISVGTPVQKYKKLQASFYYTDFCKNI